MTVVQTSVIFSFILKYPEKHPIFVLHQNQKKPALSLKILDSYQNINYTLSQMKLCRMLKLFISLPEEINPSVSGRH